MNHPTHIENGDPDTGVGITNYNTSLQKKKRKPRGGEVRAKAFKNFLFLDDDPGATALSLGMLEWLLPKIPNVNSNIN